MRYQSIVPAEFIERPNRFVAFVNVNGEREKVHVKNTGRCRELLIPGARVWLSKCANPERATAYDLVAVEKNGKVINMDSQAPNKVVEEWLPEGKLFRDLILVRPETTYGNSRFDFYAEAKLERSALPDKEGTSDGADKRDNDERSALPDKEGTSDGAYKRDNYERSELPDRKWVSDGADNGCKNEKILIEVKGVTLEEDGVASFPDAPSERAVKHVEELIRARHDGYRTCIFFVIQMENVKYFQPNFTTHRAFAETLFRAYQSGVEIYAYCCKVTPESLKIDRPVPIRLQQSNLYEIAEPLLQWYAVNCRSLPWREKVTPYRVWVSEIMLQQTRVEAVKPYFERFMSRLPTIESLASADEETLLKLWEGLGYYNRVRNLQKAAQKIMDEFGGQMPGEYEKLLALPGIGNYTAGAIASIAFGEKKPAVDGNVLRVLSRIRKDDRFISDVKVKLAVEKELEEAMSAERPGDFNQAMMEIGACVCVPNGAPHCESCPLQKLCMAHADGAEQEYPLKASKKERIVEEKTILIIRDAGRTVIRKRPKSGLLAGMYEFPSLEGFHTAEDVTRYLAESGLKILRIQDIPETKHIFSHREWHMRGYAVRVDELEPRAVGRETEDWIYIEPEETRDKYPIPSAFAAFTKMLGMRHG